jgi:hypothetical protein
MENSARKPGLKSYRETRAYARLPEGGTTASESAGIALPSGSKGFPQKRGRARPSLLLTTPAKRRYFQLQLSAVRLLFIRPGTVGHVFLRRLRLPRGAGGEGTISESFHYVAGLGMLQRIFSAGTRNGWHPRRGPGLFFILLFSTPNLPFERNGRVFPGLLDLGTG